MITLAATALLLGLLSSVHCIGMCGPLALAVPSPRNTVAARVTSALLLNAGRVTTYALLGAAFGTFGRGLQLAGLQRTVSIGLGVIILAWLLAPRLLRWVNVSQGPALLVIRAQGLMARQLRRTSPEGLFVSGLLNGLLHVEWSISPWPGPLHRTDGISEPCSWSSLAWARGLHSWA